MNQKRHIGFKVGFVFLITPQNSEEGLQLVSRRYMASANAIGIILASREQGDALAFKISFLGRNCRDLWVAGAGGAEELSAGVLILSMGEELQPFYCWRVQGASCGLRLAVMASTMSGVAKKVTHTHRQQGRKLVQE